MYRSGRLFFFIFLGGVLPFSNAFAGWVLGTLESEALARLLLASGVPAQITPESQEACVVGGIKCLRTISNPSDLFECSFTAEPRGENHTLPDQDGKMLFTLAAQNGGRMLQWKNGSVIYQQVTALGSRCQRAAGSKAGWQCEFF